MTKQKQTWKKILKRDEKFSSLKNDYFLGYSFAILEDIALLKQAEKDSIIAINVPDYDTIYDIVFDILYSDDTDKHLEIKDIHSDSFDGCPGYSHVSDKITKALLDRLGNKEKNVKQNKKQ